MQNEPYVYCMSTDDLGERLGWSSRFILLCVSFGVGRVILQSSLFSFRSGRFSLPTTVDVAMVMVMVVMIFMVAG